MVAAIFHDFSKQELGIVFPPGNEGGNKRRNERKMTGWAYEKARKGGGGDEAKEEERRKIKAGGSGAAAARRTRYEAT